MKNISLSKKVAIAILSLVMLFATMMFITQSVQVDASSTNINIIGASVRVSKPTGIRFVSSIEKDYLDNLKKNNQVEVGSLIIPKSILAGQTLTVTTAKASNVKNIQPYVKDGNYHYNAVIYDIPNTGYNTMLVCRSYIKLTDSENKIEYIYSDPIERSLVNVSKESLIDPESGLNDQGRKVLTDFVNNAVYKSNFTVNDYVDLLALSKSTVEYGKTYTVTYEIKSDSVYESGYSGESRFYYVYGQNEVEFNRYSKNNSQFEDWTRKEFTFIAQPTKESFLGKTLDSTGIYLFNVDGREGDNFSVRNVSIEEKNYGAMVKNGSAHGLIDLVELSGQTLTNGKIYTLSYEIMTTTPYYEGYTGDSRYYHVYGNNGVQFSQVKDDPFIYSDWTKIEYAFVANQTMSSFVGLNLSPTGFYVSNVDGRPTDLVYVRNVKFVEETNAGVMTKNNSAHGAIDLAALAGVTLVEGKTYDVSYEIATKETYPSWYGDDSRFYYVYGSGEYQFSTVASNPSIYKNWTKNEYTFTFSSTRSDFVGLPLASTGFYVSNVDGRTSDEFYFRNVEFKEVGVLTKNDSRHGAINLAELANVELVNGTVYTVSFDIMSKYVYGEGYNEESRFFFLYAGKEVECYNYKFNPTQFADFTNIKYTFTFGEGATSFIGIPLETDGFYFANVDGRVDDVFYFKNVIFTAVTSDGQLKRVEGKPAGVIDLAELANVSLVNGQTYTVTYEIWSQNNYPLNYSGDSRFFYLHGNNQVEFGWYTDNKTQFRTYTTLTYTFTAEATSINFCGVEVVGNGLYLSTVDSDTSDVFHIRNVIFEQQ